MAIFVQLFRVNKLVDEKHNGIETLSVLTIDSDNEFNQTIEMDNQSNDEINPFKPGKKRIRKRKRKQTTGSTVVEVQEASKSKTIEANLTVQPNKFFGKRKNDVSKSSKDANSHIRSVQTKFV